jgi:hypothetical protein
MVGMDVQAPASGATVVIPGRFNGPPASAHGGYSGGVVAGVLDAPAAEVTLRSPPPLDRRLEVERNEEGVELRRDDGSLVAEGHAIETLELHVPEPVALGCAHEASHRYPLREGHPFPTCFVCGPGRADHDGLEIFTGPVLGREALYASRWTPAAEWADASGEVRGEILWAALDCPSAIGASWFGGFDGPTSVLGRLSASLEAPVAAGEPHVIVAWPIRHDGRKRHAGTAILGSDGSVKARARALWIELRR